MAQLIPGLNCGRFEILKTAADGTLDELDIPWPPSNNLVWASPGAGQASGHTSISQHVGQGESLVPPYTRGSVSPSPSVSSTFHLNLSRCFVTDRVVSSRLHLTNP